MLRTPPALPLGSKGVASLRLTSSADLPRSRLLESKAIAMIGMVGLRDFRIGDASTEMSPMTTFFGLSPVEMIILLGLGVLLFGRKLPEVGRSVG